MSTLKDVAREADTHLIGLGHERIAFIGGIGPISTSIERREGYEEALHDHNLPVDPVLVKEGDPHRERGKRHTEVLLDLEHPPTALFAGNTLATLGAPLALRDRSDQILNM